MKKKRIIVAAGCVCILILAIVVVLLKGNILSISNNDDMTEMEVLEGNYAESDQTGMYLNLSDGQAEIHMTGVYEMKELNGGTVVSIKMDNSDQYFEYNINDSDGAINLVNDTYEEYVHINLSYLKGMDGLGECSNKCFDGTYQRTDDVDTQYVFYTNGVIEQVTYQKYCVDKEGVFSLTGGSGEKTFEYERDKSDGSFTLRSDAGHVVIKWKRQ